MKKDLNETIKKLVFKSESEDRKYIILKAISKEELLLENVSTMILEMEDSLVETVEDRIWKEMAILPDIPESISLETYKVHREKDAADENESVFSVDECFKRKYDIQQKQYLKIEYNVEIVATRLVKKLCRELSYYLLTSEILKEVENLKTM